MRSLLLLSAAFAACTAVAVDSSAIMFLDYTLNLTPKACGQCEYDGSEWSTVVCDLDAQTYVRKNTCVAGCSDATACTGDDEEVSVDYWQTLTDADTGTLMYFTLYLVYECDQHVQHDVYSDATACGAGSSVTKRTFHAPSCQNTAEGAHEGSYLCVASDGSVVDGTSSSEQTECLDPASYSVTTTHVGDCTGGVKHSCVTPSSSDTFLCALWVYTEDVPAAADTKVKFVAEGSVASTCASCDLDSDGLYSTVCDESESTVTYKTNCDADCSTCTDSVTYQVGHYTAVEDSTGATVYTLLDEIYQCDFQLLKKVWDSDTSCSDDDDVIYSAHLAPNCMTSSSTSSQSAFSACFGDGTAFDGVVSSVSTSDEFCVDPIGFTTPTALAVSCDATEKTLYECSQDETQRCFVTTSTDTDPNTLTKYVDDGETALACNVCQFEAGEYMYVECDATNSVVNLYRNCADSDCGTLANCDAPLEAAALDEERTVILDSATTVTTKLIGFYSCTNQVVKTVYGSADDCTNSADATEVLHLAPFCYNSASADSTVVDYMCTAAGDIISATAAASSAPHAFCPDPSVYEGYITTHSQSCDSDNTIYTCVSDESQTCAQVIWTEVSDDSSASGSASDAAGTMSSLIALLVAAVAGILVSL